MKRKTVLIGAVLSVALTVTTVYALFTNGGFEDGTFASWTVEHGSNSGGLQLDPVTGEPVAETVSWQPGGWDNVHTFDNITSGTGTDNVAFLLPTVKYGQHSAVVNYSGQGTTFGNSYRATRIYQENPLAESDRDPTDGRFHIRFAWAAVTESAHEPAGQSYFHVSLKNVTDNTTLYSKFYYSNQPGITWRTDNTSDYNWYWLDWQEVDLDITDNVAVGDIIRIEASASGCRYGGHAGHVYLDGFRSQRAAEGGPGPTAFDLSLNALGNGGCSVAPGGNRSGGGLASMAGGLAIWLALIVAPVGLLKRLHTRRGVRGGAGLFGLFLLLAAAALLIASGADAGQISPKTQRLHLTTDGLGAFTVDSGQTIGQGEMNFLLAANYVKRPLNKGNVSTLTIQEDRVHNLLTFDLEGAYGLTPDLELGFDIPYNLVQSGKDANGTDITDHNLGDIRVNGKWRFFTKPGAGLALVPFAVFPTGEDEVFLTQKKFSYGAKLAGHYAATGKLTLLANAGVELVTGWTRDGKSPDHYSAWIPFGVGATYALPGPRKQALVGEVNGETIMDKPFSNQIVTPIEWLLGYRAEVKPGWTMQLGGGRGFNKGIGAPQWRGFLGVAYLK
ncbi:MAG: hypothetical protein M1550_05100 [Deltaproteobacteria bacterium]|nr:hypothetical protein [Deltaproteobacteria bacterium]